MGPFKSTEAYANRRNGQVTKFFQIDGTELIQILGFKSTEAYERKRTISIRDDGWVRPNVCERNVYMRI